MTPTTGESPVWGERGFLMEKWGWGIARFMSAVQGVGDLGAQVQGDLRRQPPARARSQLARGDSVHASTLLGAED